MHTPSHPHIPIHRSFVLNAEVHGSALSSLRALLLPGLPACRSFPSSCLPSPGVERPTSKHVPELSSELAWKEVVQKHEATKLCIGRGVCFTHVFTHLLDSFKILHQNPWKPKNRLCKAFLHLSSISGSQDQRNPCLNTPRFSLICKMYTTLTWQKLKTDPKVQFLLTVNCPSVLHIIQGIVLWLD